MNKNSYSINVESPLIYGENTEETTTIVDETNNEGDPNIEIDVNIDNIIEVSIDL